MSAESLVIASKVIFSEYGLPKKIMSAAGGNFISDKFRQFCKNSDVIILPPSGQWPGSGVYKVCKTYHEKNASKLMMIYI